MGRRPTYAVETVLRASVSQFREAGFHGASVESLVEATGLNRFALYEKFGGKEGLFYTTLDFYHEVLIREELLGPLFQKDAPFSSLLEMLRTVRSNALDPQQRAGCLIVNANIEFGGTDGRVESAAAAVVQSFREAIFYVLELASRRGEIDGTTTSSTERTEHLALMIQAFFSLAYISRTTADQLILRVINEAESWRIAARVGVPSA